MSYLKDCNDVSKSFYKFTTYIIAETGIRLRYKLCQVYFKDSFAPISQTLRVFAPTYIRSKLNPIVSSILLAVYCNRPSPTACVYNKSVFPAPFSPKISTLLLPTVLFPIIL